MISRICSQLYCVCNTVNMLRLLGYVAYGDLRIISIEHLECIEDKYNHLAMDFFLVHLNNTGVGR